MLFVGLVADAYGRTSTEDTTRQWRALRLERCRALDVFTVTFDHNDHDGHRHGRKIFSTTVDLLTHLPTSIGQVRIRMIPDPTAALDVGDGATEPPNVLLEDLDWQALDEVLSAPRFKRLDVTLEVVTLRDAFSRDRCWKILANIRVYLPLLSSRDMLTLLVCE